MPSNITLSIYNTIDKEKRYTAEVIIDENIYKNPLFELNQNIYQINKSFDTECIPHIFLPMTCQSGSIKRLYTQGRLKLVFKDNNKEKLRKEANDVYELLTIMANNPKDGKIEYIKNRKPELFDFVTEDDIKGEREKIRLEFYSDDFLLKMTGNYLEPDELNETKPTKKTPFNISFLRYNNETDAFILDTVIKEGEMESMKINIKSEFMSIHDSGSIPFIIPAKIPVFSQLFYGIDLNEFYHLGGLHLVFEASNRYGISNAAKIHNELITAAKQAEKTGEFGFELESDIEKILS